MKTNWIDSFLDQAGKIQKLKTTITKPQTEKIALSERHRKFGKKSQKENEFENGGLQMFYFEQWVRGD